MNTYLVGGALRDKLLGFTPKERDWVVVGQTPEQMIAEGFKKVGKDFPVFLHPKTHEEYALARTERKVGKGYYGFECYAAPEVTLEEDLARRDITINAMAEAIDGTIIDPFGGQNDLAQKKLRHVSAAFSEDPVRILRVARFCARFHSLGFQVAEETLALMQTMVREHEVDALVPERVWQELLRALSEPDPDQFFLTLRACSALAVLWPELDRLWGVPQPERYHPEIDTGIHTMMVLKQAVLLSDSPVVRFAALCHDLGKGNTPKDKWPSHHGHEERGVPLIESFCDRYRVPKTFRRLAVLVSRFHLHAHRAFELTPKTLLKTLEHLDVFRQPETLEDFLLVCEADAKGRLGRETSDYPQANRFRQAAQAARSVEVGLLQAKGLSGQALGNALHAARVHAIERLK